MRIVHVTRQFPPGVGGIEEVVAQLVEAQARAGHSVRVVTLDRVFADPDVKLVAHETWMGAQIVRLPFRGSTRYPLAPAVLRHIGDADIVHVHAIDFFFDFLAATRPIHRRKLVATTHGGFFHTDAHARIKRLWFSTITRLSAGVYDAIVACSAPDLEMFKPIAPRNLRLIENGVDIQKFAGRASRAPVRRLVAIGRFSANKRPERLLDALAELARRGEDFDLELVGAESDWTGAELAAEIAARKLATRVRLHVGPTNDEIARVLDHASLFVSASEHEGFGISLIEALSAGLLPVVEANAAFRAFAARIEDVALTNYAAPAQAADAIVEAYDRLAADPAAVRARLVAAAAPFAWPGVAARYLALYEEVLAR